MLELLFLVNQSIKKASWYFHAFFAHTEKSLTIITIIARYTKIVPGLSKETVVTRQRKLAEKKKWLYHTALQEEKLRYEWEEKGHRRKHAD